MPIALIGPSNGKVNPTLYPKSTINSDENESHCSGEFHSSLESMTRIYSILESMMRIYELCTS